MMRLKHAACVLLLAIAASAPAHARQLQGGGRVTYDDIFLNVKFAVELVTNTSGGESVSQIRLTVTNKGTAPARIDNLAVGQCLLRAGDYSYTNRFWRVNAHTF